MTKVYEFARRSPGTRLIIVSPEQKILITKEYRPEIKAWDYRLPGGKVFNSLSEYNDFLKTGEDILIAAKAAAVIEAQEEVGLKVGRIKHFATSTCGATMRWDLFYFIITDYQTLDKTAHGSGENIQTNWFSLIEAKNLALTGQMSEDRSAAVLLRYLFEQGIS